MTNLTDLTDLKNLGRITIKRWLIQIISISVAICCWLGMGGIDGQFMRFIPSTPVAMATTLVKQTPVEVDVHLGTEAGELKFVPNHLEFEVGKRYMLRLDNPSSQKHYFTAKDFADGIWTQKVDAGNVEIKGAIHELELKAGALADWVFIPLQPGQYELHCSVKGHAEAGMIGLITVSDS